MTNSPRHLRFKCRITSGHGMYSELTFPGREEFPDVPDDWPETLFPGSLNALVIKNGYPTGFVAPEIGGDGVQVLDDGDFAPAFVIPGHLIGKNMLLSSTDPRRGSAQVWRAEIRVHRNSQDHGCWVVRRIGSGVGKELVGNVLEVMSEKRLRDELGIGNQNGHRVSVTMFEGRGTSLLGDG